MTRRDRLERIATAERDRRAGRIDMAVASLGEPTEWPARAVLALARLPEGEGAATRRVLESGLDLWADELGLDPLSAKPTPAMGDDLSFEALEGPTLGDVQDELDRPIEAFELDEAFAQAETQVDEMVDVNEVAQRVLLDEPLGLAEIAEEGVSAGIGEPIELGESHQTPVFFEPVFAEEEGEDFDVSAAEQEGPDATLDAAIAPTGFDFASNKQSHTPLPATSVDGKPSDALILATLEGWLHNLTNNPRRNAR